MSRKTGLTSRELRRIIGLMLAATTVVGASGCRKGDANAEPAGTESVVIGPENIVVVAEQEIRTGPALSGALAPEREATVRAELSAPVVETLIDQGQRVAAGQLLNVGGVVSTVQVTSCVQVLVLLQASTAV